MQVSQSLDSYRQAIEAVREYRRSFQYEVSKFVLTDEATDLYDGAIAIATNLYDITKENSYLEDVFFFMEQNKFSILLDDLIELEALGLGGVPDSLINRERGLKKNLAFYDWKLKNEEYNKSVANEELVDKWRAKLFEVNEEYELLLREIELRQWQHHMCPA